MSGLTLRHALKVLEFPADSRPRVWLERWRQVRAESALWTSTPTVDHFGEVNAWFCEGRLSFSPGHVGPVDGETGPIGQVLAHCNRRGLITTSSQPGADVGSFPFNPVGEQRAAVDGRASPAVLDSLRVLTADTRIRLITGETPRWRTDYDDGIPVGRSGGLPVTEFGARVTDSYAADLMFGGVRDDVLDEILSWPQVTLIDTEWGDQSLLWDLLGSDRWGRPSTVAPSTPPLRPTRSSPAAVTLPAPTATPTSTSVSAGGTMSTIADVRGSVLSAADTVEQHLGAQQQTIDALERARAGLQHAMETSSQADVSEAVGMLGAAEQAQREVMQRCLSAIQMARDVAHRL